MARDYRVNPKHSTKQSRNMKRMLDQGHLGRALTPSKKSVYDRMSTKSPKKKRAASPPVQSTAELRKAMKRKKSMDWAENMVRKDNAKLLTKSEKRKLKPRSATTRVSRPASKGKKK